MSKFGWIATDNTGTQWQDGHFKQHDGSPTHWAQFVEFLEREGRYLTKFSLRSGHHYYTMQPNADQYSFHYSMEVIISSLGSTSKKRVVGIAVSGDLATIREVNEEGQSWLHPSYRKDVKMMKPSPERVA